VQTAPNTETQAFAAMQAADEARHIEIYTRLLDDKWGIHFAMAEPLTRLTDAVFRDGRWDVTSLGLQILVEGLALASFAIMRDQSRNPLIRAIHAYVMEDEARHVGFGHRLLAPYYAQLSDGERAEREEIVIESSYLLRDRLFAPESLWDHCGLPGERCAAWLRDSGLQRAQAAALFTRIIPAVRAIGLWSTRVQRAYGQLGLLELGVHELDHQRSDDERRAAAIERGDA